VAISAASGTVYGCLDAQREEEDSQKSNMCMSCSSVPLTAAALSAASGTVYGCLDAQREEEDSQISNMRMSCSSAPLTAAALSAASGSLWMPRCSERRGGQPKKQHVYELF